MAGAGRRRRRRDAGRHIEELGLQRPHRRGHRARCSATTAGDRARRCRTRDPIDADIVVFSAGIRPRDALARAAGLDVAERGGVLVDEQCRTSDPHVWAIGECAAPGGRMYGLVAPGYAMAEVVVDALLGGPGAFTGADMSTKLKLLGVDVASLRRRLRHHRGRAGAGLRRRGGRRLQEARGQPRTAQRLLGGILVGDASAYGVLRPMVRRSAASSCPTTPRS